MKFNVIKEKLKTKTDIKYKQKNKNKTYPSTFPFTFDMNAYETQNNKADILMTNWKPSYNSAATPKTKLKKSKKIGIKAETFI
ncbi:hypothetical protein [Shewanella colwelliana]|uniref:hypothetical protein n=1 Tax=Shewanella colwelliana TaxID=23 RepID=UPI00048C76A1|nr:hypothetical protein [Shewanella colwelliana]